MKDHQSLMNSNLRERKRKIYNINLMKILKKQKRIR